LAVRELVVVIFNDVFHLCARYLLYIQETGQTNLALKLTKRSSKLIDIVILQPLNDSF